MIVLYILLIPEIPPPIEPLPPPIKSVVPKPVASAAPIIKTEELGPHQILTAIAESPDTPAVSGHEKRDATAEINLDRNKEVSALSKIRTIVDDCIKK